MKTAPVVPARVERGAGGVPFSSDYGDVYHPRSGALEQARHVFLAGNGLPARWSQRTRFVILETGFGLGNNFLATWDAWRADPHRCERLHFISIEQHPLRREDLAGLHRGSVLEPLAARLVDAWPSLTCNLHRLDFDAGRVQLSLCFGEVSAWLPALVAQVDAFYLDGFAPARNPQMWQPRLFKALARMATPDATAATWSAARLVRDGLASAGFEVTRAAGSGGKRDTTLARFAPRFTPRRAPSRIAPTDSNERRALIVGGGLAGCAAAWALAQQGWRSTVFDCHGYPAQEASGNPAGLFHGIVNAQDGAHARFNRAAALQARQAVADAIADEGVVGSTAGLIRLETAANDPNAMRRVLASLGLPDDYAQVLDAEAASALAGLRLHDPAWFFPGGGWVDPGHLARSFLARAGACATWRGQTRVERIERVAGGWRLFDSHDRTFGEAAVVVLANAGDGLRLLGRPAWPVEAIRGQLTCVRATVLTRQGLSLPRLPIAGSGYLLPELDGAAWFGATSQTDDSDPLVRSDDHRLNIARLERLLGRPLAVDPRCADGRTAWRWTSRDRMPVVGGVPDVDRVNAALADPAGLRLDQPRLVPRLPGLFVFSALGSRGITWSVLAARVLAAWVSGAPMPLEADLLDAIDPARFATRALRRRRQ